MVPAWTSNWVGRPHTPRGRTETEFDCLGLYILLNRVRLGVIIPDPYCSVPDAVRNNIAGRMRGEYEQVSTPEEGDAILIRARGHPIHVAYCIDQKLMIHVEDGELVSVERWDSTRWQQRIIGVYRYVS